MLGSVLNLKLGIDSLKHFTPLRMTAWELDCPSVAPSSRVIMAACGRRPTMVQERRFHSQSLDCPRVWLVSAVLTPGGRLPGRRREESVMAKRSLVSVVDDDESVRESLPD